MREIQSFFIYLFDDKKIEIRKKEKSKWRSSGAVGRGGIKYAKIA